MNTRVKKPSMKEARFGSGSKSVARQIVLAEERLDRRKKNALALGLSMETRIRSGLVSPTGLLIAGGIGFLAAEWLHRPRLHRPGKATDPARDTPAESSPGDSQASPMSKALVLVKFALDLKKATSTANSRK